MCENESYFYFHFSFDCDSQVHVPLGNCPDGSVLSFFPAGQNTHVCRQSQEAHGHGVSGKVLNCAVLKRVTCFTDRLRTACLISRANFSCMPSGLIERCFHCENWGQLTLDIQ